MRAVLKIIYAPAMLLGFNGVALWIIGSGAQHAWLMPLLLGAIGISFLVERLMP